MELSEKDKMQKLSGIISEEYGGKEYGLPSTHKAGLQVPKGGSCCANCKFWNTETKECISEHYKKWNGDGKIPLPADEYCSDWWEPKNN